MREIDPLLHAAAQLQGIGVLEAGEPDQLDLLLRALDRLLLRERALGFDTEDDVAEDRAPRQQAGLLEHHRPVRTGCVDLAAVEREAAARDRDEPVDGVQERRLAAAGRPHDRDELARADRQVDALHRREEGLRPLQPVLDDDAPRRELRRAVDHRS